MEVYMYKLCILPNYPLLIIEMQLLLEPTYDFISKKPAFEVSNK